MTATEILKSTKGKFFSVTFVKKDGSIRVLNGRLGVKKYTHGGELKFDPEGKGLMVVFDVIKKGYRMINLGTVRKIKFKKEYIF